MDFFYLFCDRPHIPHDAPSDLEVGASDGGRRGRCAPSQRDTTGRDRYESIVRHQLCGRGFFFFFAFFFALDIIHFWCTGLRYDAPRRRLPWQRSHRSPAARRCVWLRRRQTRTEFFFLFLYFFCDFFFVASSIHSPSHLLPGPSVRLRLGRLPDPQGKREALR